MEQNKAFVSFLLKKEGRPESFHTRVCHHVPRLGEEVVFNASTWIVSRVITDLDTSHNDGVPQVTVVIRRS